MHLWLPMEPQVSMSKPVGTEECQEKIYRVRAVSDGRIIRLPNYVRVGTYYTPQLNPDGSITLIPMVKQKPEIVKI